MSRVFEIASGALSQNNTSSFKCIKEHIFSGTVTNSGSDSRVAGTTNSYIGSFSVQDSVLYKYTKNFAIFYYTITINSYSLTTSHTSGANYIANAGYGIGFQYCFGAEDNNGYPPSGSYVYYDFIDTKNNGFYKNIPYTIATKFFTSYHVSSTVVTSYSKDYKLSPFSLYGHRYNENAGDITQTFNITVKLYAK